MTIPENIFAKRNFYPCEDCDKTRKMLIGGGVLYDNYFSSYTIAYVNYTLRR